MEVWARWGYICYVGEIHHQHASYLCSEVTQGVPGIRDLSRTVPFSVNMLFQESARVASCKGPQKSSWITHSSTVIHWTLSSPVRIVWKWMCHVIHYPIYYLVHVYTSHSRTCNDLSWFNPCQYILVSQKSDLLSLGELLQIYVHKHFLACLGWEVLVNAFNDSWVSIISFLLPFHNSNSGQY